MTCVSIYSFNCIAIVSGKTLLPPKSFCKRGLFSISICQFNSLLVLFANIMERIPGVLNPKSEEKAFHSIVSSIKAFSKRWKIPVIAFDIACCWFCGSSGMTLLLTLQSGSFGLKASLIAFCNACSGPLSKRSAAFARSLIAFSFCLFTNSSPKAGSENAAARSWSQRSFCSFVKQILVSTG